VLLIDGLPVLGGQAVNSIVGTICGMFSNGKDGYQVTYGIAEDIIRDLSRTGAIHYRQGVNNIIIYDEVALARWIENAVLEAGVKVLLGAIVREVEVKDRRIKSLGLSTRYGDVRVGATGFIDASGDAALVWQAGFPCQEAADGPVFGTQMVVLEGIDEAHVPSREELPVLSAYATQHAAEGLIVLGFTLDSPDNLHNVQQAAQSLRFPVGFLANSSLPGYGRIWRIPVNFTINRAGALIDDGWKDKDPAWTAKRLERIVTPLLNN